MTAVMGTADFGDEEVDALTPTHKQLAALCFRKGKKGREILMVTSSEGRWILPKGWPMKKKHDSEAALIEAWEEGGVKKGKVNRKPMGKYLGRKILKNGEKAVTETKVYEVKVSKMKDDYPEAEERDRRWVSPKKASKLVTEKGLKKLLKGY